MTTARHSLEAEQSVIGGLMLDNSTWDTVSDIVTADDFSRHDHRAIFRAIAALANQSDPFDVVTLSEWLERQGELGRVGGLAYLGTLAKDTPSAANIKAYAAIVRERSTLRQLGQTAQQVISGLSGPQSVADQLDAAQAAIMEINAQASQQGGPVAIRTIIPHLLETLDQRLTTNGTITGLPTGFAALDDMTCGLHPADLIIIAGRPSMGKTALAVDIARHVAMDAALPVLVFSLEMSAQQLTERLTSSVGKVDGQQLRRADLDDTEWARVTHATTTLQRAPLYIDDTAALHIHDLRSRARRHAREHGASLIVVDYLQLMRGEGDNQTQRIGSISAGLKALAKDLRVPVIALSQLNRSLAQRTNKRPVMSDLRDSGNLEQDADLIAFLYRDEVYHEDSPAKGTAEVIIGKQRNGPIGTVYLQWQGEFTRFADYGGPPPENYPPSPAKPKNWTGGFDYQD